MTLTAIDKVKLSRQCNALINELTSGNLSPMHKVQKSRTINDLVAKLNGKTPTKATNITSDSKEILRKIVNSTSYAKDPYFEKWYAEADIPIQDGDGHWYDAETGFYFREEELFPVEQAKLLPTQFKCDMSLSN